MSPSSGLDHEVHARAHAALEPGERIRWIAGPVPRRYARRGLWQVVAGICVGAFVLALLVFMLAVEDAGASGVERTLPWLVTGPFLLLALFFLAAPYRMRRRARRIAYVVTDRRALVVEGSGRRAVTEVPLGEVVQPTGKRSRDGTGDLHVGDIEAGIDDEGTAVYRPVVFRALADVADAERELLAAKGAWRQTQRG